MAEPNSKPIDYAATAASLDADDPNRPRRVLGFRDLVLFYEHFHGDNGRGIGASHQTGWTALVTRCLEKITSHTTDDEAEVAAAIRK